MLDAVSVGFVAAIADAGAVAVGVIVAAAENKITTYVSMLCHVRICRRCGNCIRGC